MSESAAAESGVPSAITWQEWLVRRPEPEPVPGGRVGDLTGADAVAFQLRHGVDGLIDFSLQSCRDGMRQLFAEFESGDATAPGETSLTRRGASGTPRGLHGNDEVPQPHLRATEDRPSSEPRVQG